MEEMDKSWKFRTEDDLEMFAGVPLQSVPCCWPEQVERGWYPDHTPNKVVLGDSEEGSRR